MVCKGKCSSAAQQAEPSAEQRRIEGAVCVRAHVWALRRFVWLSQTLMPCQPADS